MNPAPAIFCGVQAGLKNVPDFELYNLTAPVGSHPVGSSVSRNTLERHGYTVPPITREQRQAKAKALVGY